MKMAFTICSVNYLAQAKALGDSLLANNKGYEYVICLVDKIKESGVPAELLPPYTIIEAEKLNMPDWEGLTDKYSIVELNTAVKASFFKYLFKNYLAESVIFFDPDILVLNSLYRIEEELKQYSIVLTPHTCTPVTYPGGLPERAFLNYGIYNLGFIALKNTEITSRFLDWWEQKQIHECYIDTYNGLYVDQLWAELTPVYFDDVYVDKYIGNNVAFWNLHERTVIFENNTYFVNDTRTPLIFFHFSKVKINTGQFVPGMTTTDIDSPAYDATALRKLIQEYCTIMVADHHNELRQYKCFYEDMAGKNQKRFIKKNLPGFIKRPLISFSKKVLGIKTDRY